MRRWLAVLALLWPLVACAVNPYRDPLKYSPEHGQFTVRYNYCVGWSCPAPETFGPRPKIGKGWVEVVIVHAPVMEFYRSGVPLTYEEALADPFVYAAVVIGWGFTSRHQIQTVNGFKLVSVNLEGGYMADTRIDPGIRRQP